tara:strand:- start:11767 stop:11934 length:168 start_codon:yes stop_codon:yes gene_type:complete
MTENIYDRIMNIRKHMYGLTVKSENNKKTNYQDYHEAVFPTDEELDMILKRKGIW